MKASVTVNGRALTFTFADGSSQTVSLDELAPGVVERLALHGLEQKLRDSYAGAEEAEVPGYVAKTWSRLVAGEWAAHRPAKPKGVSLLTRAVAAVMREQGKEPPANLAEMVEGLSRSERAKLRFDARVSAKIAELRGPGESILDSLF